MKNITRNLQTWMHVVFVMPTSINDIRIAKRDCLYRCVVYAYTLQCILHAGIQIICICLQHFS
jgi:hypothetical protein